MQLKIFRSMEGCCGSLEEFEQQITQSGFDGVEGRVPRGTRRRIEFSRLLKMHNLGFIAELSTSVSCTSGRKTTPDDHLRSFYRGFEQSLLLEPVFVNCIGGSDTWSESESVDFFGNAISYAKAAGVSVTFETHRGRSLSNPWITQKILAQLPEMEITCDFSRWCDVCDRMVRSELDVIEKIARRARHIHARVGNDQGQQVLDPAAPEYQSALVARQKLWEIIWRAQKDRGFRVTTMTPEFGPGGYFHQFPFTREPAANLWELNKCMAAKEQTHFDSFISSTAS